MFKVKRAYEPVEEEDGARYLVDQLWPRGVTRNSLQIEDWLKDVAPSDALRRWFKHAPERWDEFRRRYFAELDSKPDSWTPLVGAATTSPITLVYSARDAEHNNGVALSEYLNAHAPEKKSKGGAEMEPAFFATPIAWREWLEKNYTRRKELLVGFYKKGSGKPSITWPESVDAALCFGWIDGIRRRIDEESYTVRFTPRKPRSTWSTVNIKRVEELTAKHLMRPAGIKAFEARREERSGLYSFERQSVKFGGAQQQVFRANKSAWKYF